MQSDHPTNELSLGDQKAKSSTVWNLHRLKYNYRNTHCESSLMKLRVCSHQESPLAPILWSGPKNNVSF